MTGDDETGRTRALEEFAILYLKYNVMGLSIQK
jgi:hypothetical protein